MKKLALILFLALSPVLAQKEANKKLDTIIQEQIQSNWFSKGDMYEWRNKKAPLKIIVCEDDLFPAHLLSGYDSIVVVRDDSVFEANIFKDGNQWHPSYKVDKGYLERLTPDYLKGWLEQTNYWLNYLSGGKFQLELENIEYIKTNYWNDSFSFNYGTAFTMIVHPHGSPMRGGGGYYSGNGIFWVDPLSLSYDKNDKNKCTPVPIHEILHSFFGPGHSPDTLSTAYTPSFYIYLTKEESEFLGWPKVEPKKLKTIKF